MKNYGLQASVAWYYNETHPLMGDPNDNLVRIVLSRHFDENRWWDTEDCAEEAQEVLSHKDFLSWCPEDSYVIPYLCTTAGYSENLLYLDYVRLYEKACNRIACFMAYSIDLAVVEVGHAQP